MTKPEKSEAVLHLQSNLTALKPLATALSKASSTEQKLKILNDMEGIRIMIDQVLLLPAYLQSATLQQELVIKSIAVIGQLPLIFQHFDDIPGRDRMNALDDLFRVLLPVEEFYSTIGGIVGYHAAMIELIIRSQTPFQPNPENYVSFLNPPGFDISANSPFLRKAIRKGIESMHEMAEIYPVGGAGDRLDLRDENTHEPLPSAELQFCGRSLLEGLIRDIQAREFLYYKLTGKEIVVPIVMMTSQEKRNHEHILEICQREDWFGRDVGGFHIFIQPLVPLVTIHGDWAVSSPCKLMLKPGGHGVIWKLANDYGIFDLLKSDGIKKAILRQINNPIAGLDSLLLAFAGVGIEKNKAFGFCSCPRVLNTAEGMNVLIEEERKENIEYRISNIEYTDFIQKGIHDIPSKEGGAYSIFPANTNILFADLETVQEIVKILPIPGMLINMKNTVSCLDAQGMKQNVQAGRLESLMQNLADGITDVFKGKIPSPAPDDFKTFLTNSQRQKTISVTKKSYTPGQPMIETPVGCFYDLLANAHSLLKERCGMDIPAMPDENQFAATGPSFLFLYHPALGPLFSIIAQKIRGGKLASHSEMILEIAEAYLENVQVQGSMHIISDAVLGKKEANKTVFKDNPNGKCFLKNVQVSNKGINFQADNIFWKQKVKRHECLSIHLHGNAEFFAENVRFSGGLKIEVPEGHLMTAYEKNNTLHLALTPIKKPTWHWTYAFDDNDEIRLSKQINI